MLGAIALLAVPAIFALVRREAVSTAVAKTSPGDAHPALATETDPYAPQA